MLFEYLLDAAVGLLELQVEVLNIDFDSLIENDLSGVLVEEDVDLCEVLNEDSHSLVDGLCRILFGLEDVLDAADGGDEEDLLDLLVLALLVEDDHLESVQDVVLRVRQHWLTWMLSLCCWSCSFKWLIRYWIWCSLHRWFSNVSNALKLFPLIEQISTPPAPPSGLCSPCTPSFSASI